MDWDKAINWNDGIDWEVVGNLTDEQMSAIFEMFDGKG